MASGAACWLQQLGLDGAAGADVFSHIYATPPDVLRFMRGMHAFSALSAPAVVRAFPDLLSRASTLVDLGGATGALALAALEVHAGGARRGGGPEPSRHPSEQSP